MPDGADGAGGGADGAHRPGLGRGVVGTVDLGACDLGPAVDARCAGANRRACGGRVVRGVPGIDWIRAATFVAFIDTPGAYPGIVTSVKRRRFLRTVLAAKGILNPVLSYEELGTDAKPALLGLVPT